MKATVVMPWVGLNPGRLSFVGTERARMNGRSAELGATSSDSFIQVTTLWWERFAATGQWKSAAALGKLCAEKRPDSAYGYENWAWALHKLGETRRAHGLLAPLLKRLKLPGPPSGRAAYCLACFCGTLDRVDEGTRWLRLAYTLAADKDVFRHHAILEPDLRAIWPGIPELSCDAVSFLE